MIEFEPYLMIFFISNVPYLITLSIKYQIDLQHLMDENQHEVKLPFGTVVIVNHDFSKSVRVIIIKIKINRC